MGRRRAGVLGALGRWRLRLSRLRSSQFPNQRSTFPPPLVFFWVLGGICARRCSIPTNEIWISCELSSRAGHDMVSSLLSWVDFHDLGAPIGVYKSLAAEWSWSWVRLGVWGTPSKGCRAKPATGATKNPNPQTHDLKTFLYLATNSAHQSSRALCVPKFAQADFRDDKMINPVPGCRPISAPGAPGAQGAPGSGPGLKNSADCIENQPGDQYRVPFVGNLCFRGRPQNDNKVHDKFGAPQSLPSRPP